MAKPEIVMCGVPFDNPNIKEILKKIKADGVTSVQIYIHWSKFEPEERGKFDFSFYDEQVELLKEAGLKFVPFILIGPRWAFPKWWLEDKRHKSLFCLEHHKECPVESIWNPEFRTEIDRVIKAYAGHYLPMDILESVQPGICGDYGESIMPVHGNWAGSYHTHKGMWCAGEDAIADFRKWLSEKYESIDALNAAWRSSYSDFSDISTFQKHKAPSRTAWFNEIEWYRDAMTGYVDFWMACLRKHFPETPLYMCTGGIESPEESALFSDQAKVCAKYNGGIRLTNEANKFFVNFFSGAAYTHSACEHYGAYLGLEPVGPMTAEGNSTRIFSSAVYGNRQIFFYYSNIYTPEEMDGNKAKMFAKYIGMIKERKTQRDTAILWPTYLGIEEGGIPESLREVAGFIRQRTDYKFVNENMIADGALDSTKLLIIPNDIFTRRDTLHTICEWVKNGGILFTAGKVTDLELERVEEFDDLIGLLPETDEWWGHEKYDITENIPYKKFEAEKNFHHNIGYAPLSKDAVILSTCKARYMDFLDGDSTEIYNAFYKDCGKGRAITYLGPKDLVKDEQALFTSSSFPALLDDILSVYARDLKIQPGEVVRGEIDGEIYALYPDGEIKKV